MSTSLLTFRKSDLVYSKPLTLTQRQALVAALLESFHPTNDTFLLRNIAALRSRLLARQSSEDLYEPEIKEIFEECNLVGFKAQVYATISLKSNTVLFKTENRVFLSDNARDGALDVLVQHIALQLNAEDVVKFIVAEILLGKNLESFPFKDFGKEKTLAVLQLLESQHFGKFTEVFDNIASGYQGVTVFSLTDREWFNLVVKYQKFHSIKTDDVRNFAVTFYDAPEYLSAFQYETWIKSRAYKFVEPKPKKTEPVVKLGDFFEVKEGIIENIDAYEWIVNQLTSEEQKLLLSRSDYLLKHAIRVSSLAPHLDETVSCRRQIAYLGGRVDRVVTAIIFRTLWKLTTWRENDTNRRTNPRSYGDICNALLLALPSSVPDEWLPVVYSCEFISLNDFVVDVTLTLRRPSDEAIEELVRNGILKGYRVNLSRNPDMDSDILKDWLSGRGFSEWSVSLPGALLDNGYADFLLKDGDYLPWFRKTYEIDDELPDTWVIEMVKALGQPKNVTA